MSKLAIKQQKITTQLVKNSDTDYTFTVTPLAPGFGHTVGNSLRRILLSSIPGYAVTRVSINDDVTHEYQSVDGVVEDALDIMLNLKNLHVSVKNNLEKVTLTLKKKGAGVVTAADFTTDSSIEVSNPDLYICTLDKTGSITLEVDVELGYGYLPLERVDLTSNSDPRKLLVDALFSPVTNVSLAVEDVRVGEMTNYNKLSLSFTTDGTIDGQTIISQAFDRNIEVLHNIKNIFEGVEVTESTVESDGADLSVAEAAESTDTGDDLIEIKPKKIINILAKQEITTNAQLLAKKDEISEIAGLDEKMIEAISKYIKKLDK